MNRQPERPADILFPQFAANKRAQRCAFDDGKGAAHDVSTFKDALSHKEFGISGLCQACQDSVFGGDES